ncbi:MAG: hypothetical protein ACRC18_00530 [Cetobacterium sp.]
MFYLIILIIPITISLCIYYKIWGHKIKNHSAKEFIIFTLTVIGMALGVAKFIFYDNVNLAQNKMNDALKAQIESLKESNEILKEKNQQLSEVKNSHIKMYENKIAIIEAEKNLYLEILQKTKGTPEYYKNQINNLKENLANKELEIEKLNNKKVLDKDASNEISKKKYSAIFSKKIGEAIIDTQSGITLGVTSINSSYTIDGIISLGGNEEKLLNIPTGKKWTNKKNGSKYEITITKIDWIKSEYEAIITEIF